MAKKSSIEKNNRRKRMTKNAAPKRARLKAIIADKKKPMEERFAATLKLAELPRNSSATRIRNRCEMTGRPRSVYRKNKLSRIALREVELVRGVGHVNTRSDQRSHHPHP
jgi:small subunit ribosomal protein S14